MAIPESGAVSFSEIQTEFTGSNPISLSEYLGITAIPDNIPESGTVSISDFRGAAYIIPEQSDQWISFTGTSTFTGGLGRNYEWIVIGAGGGGATSHKDQGASAGAAGGCVRFLLNLSYDVSIIGNIGSGGAGGGNVFGADGVDGGASTLVVGNSTVATANGGSKGVVYSGSNFGQAGVNVFPSGGTATASGTGVSNVVARTGGEGGTITAASVLRSAGGGAVHIGAVTDTTLLRGLAVDGASGAAGGGYSGGSPRGNGISAPTPPASSSFFGPFLYEDMARTADDASGDSLCGGGASKTGNAGAGGIGAGGGSFNWANASATYNGGAGGAGAIYYRVYSQ